MSDFLNSTPTWGDLARTALILWGVNIFWRIGERLWDEYRSTR